jgi:hypothetical protein
MSNQVQNKPTAAYILSLLGGIFGLIMAAYYLYSGYILYTTYGGLTSIYGDLFSDYGSGLFGWSWTLLFGIGIWALITSILIAVFAGKLNSNPMGHSKWGALILVFSILGALTLLGALLAFIGGILALVYKPIPISGQPMYQQPYGQPQPYTSPPPPAYAPNQQPITRICPQCGRVVNENTKFCPHCGKQLN